MSTVFKGGRPIDQLRLAGNTFIGRLVAKQLPDASCVIYIIIIAHDFVVISKCCTFTSSTFEK